LGSPFSSPLKPQFLDSRLRFLYSRAIGRPCGSSGEDTETHEPANNAPSDTARGAAAYTRTNLAIYNLFVLGFSNTFAWKCPSRAILDHYNRHVTDRHLDVGVGTGYFLDKCRFPGPSPAITLMDLNPNSLAATAKRLRRYKPTRHEVDVLQPIDAPLSDFSLLTARNAQEQEGGLRRT
jgi:hypothetical protein